MPEDMPREDYSTPAMYTFRMLAKILRYVLYGTLGLGTVGLVGLEGGHQYLENVLMAYPSHINTEKVDPSSEDALFAWAEENDAWTGGSSGGTSSKLGIYNRHILRSAWLAQEYGVGSSGTTAIGREERSGHAAPGGNNLKGMIGTNGSASSNVNTVDPGSTMAEDYLARTIDEARKKGIAFPANLPGTRDLYPPTILSVSQQPPVDRVAIDLLIRHAESLERIQGHSALQEAEETYERILYAVLGQSTTNNLAKTVQKAEALKLAKKLGDVSSRLGQDERAAGWWRWGLSVAEVHLPVITVNDAAPLLGNPIKGTERKGWFAGWIPGPNETNPTAVAPSAAQQHNLAENSRLVDHTAPATHTDAHPLVRRAIVSLIASYASNLALKGNLDQARAYQSLGISLTDAIDSTKESSPAASLQNLWLNHRSALLSLNHIEVAYAQGQGVQDSIDALGQATRRAEEVIRNLASPFTSNPKQALNADGSVSRYDPSKGIPVRTMNVAPRFGANVSSSPLARPASQLLRDAERIAAEGWNLIGLLYEKAARATKSPLDRQAIQELALDCHEKAMGWSMVASGGEADGLNQIAVDQEALGLGGRGVGKTTEYWRNYIRVRSKLEAEVTGTV
jgi:hypothetical protein